jgi:hypothetical protein
MTILIFSIINTLLFADVSAIESTKFVFGKTGSEQVVSGQASYTQLSSFFGKAYKKEKLYNEIDENYYYKYSHEGATFNVNGNKVEDFEIRSPKYYVGEPGKMIKVGDSLASLSIKYPASYKEREGGSIIIYFTGLTGGKVWISDSYLLIRYNARTSKITMINLRGPCC